MVDEDWGIIGTLPYLQLVELLVEDGLHVELCLLNCSTKKSSKLEAYGGPLTLR